MPPCTLQHLLGLWSRLIQLSFGECTDKTKIHPEPEAGKRIFSTGDPSRVAPERYETAREAVKLMG